MASQSVNIPDFLISLLTDGDFRAAFLEDPQGRLAAHGLDDLSREEVIDTVEALCHQLPAEEAAKFDDYLSEAAAATASPAGEDVGKEAPHAVEGGSAGAEASDIVAAELSKLVVTHNITLEPNVVLELQPLSEAVAHADARADLIDREGAAPFDDLREGVAPGENSLDVAPAFGEGADDSALPGDELREGVAPGDELGEGATAPEGIHPQDDWQEDISPQDEIISPQEELREGVAPGNEFREGAAPFDDLREGVAPGENSLDVAPAFGEGADDSALPGDEFREGPTAPEGIEPQDDWQEGISPQDETVSPEDDFREAVAREGIAPQDHFADGGPESGSSMDEQGVNIPDFALPGTAPDTMAVEGLDSELTGDQLEHMLNTKEYGDEQTGLEG